MTIAKINVDTLNLVLKTSNPSAVEGQLIYNSTDKKLRIYNGTAWVDMGGYPANSNTLSAIQSNFIFESDTDGRQEAYITTKTATSIFCKVELQAYTELSLAGGITPFWSCGGLNTSGWGPQSANAYIYLGDTVADTNTLLKAKMASAGFKMPKGFIYSIIKNDHNSTPSDFLVRGNTTGQTGNPVTGFASYGTEFSGTEYDNSASYLDANYVSVTTRYFWIKATNITIKDYLMAVYAIQMNAWDAARSDLNTYLWNFNTSAWDNINWAYVGWSSGARSAGLYQGTPIAIIPSSYTNYISSGTIYTRLDMDRAGGSSGFYVGYLGTWTAANHP